MTKTMRCFKFYSKEDLIVESEQRNRNIGSSQQINVTQVNCEKWLDFGIILLAKSQIAKDNKILLSKPPLCKLLMDA